MRLATIAASTLLFVSIALGLAGCQRAEPPPPPPPAPVSIWTDADAKTVADQAVGAAASDAWTSQFRDRNGRPAKVVVGEISDRSGKHVDTEAFAAALATALAAAGEKLASAPSADAADCILRGSVGASEAVEDGQPVTYFTIDLTFADAKTGDPIWPFAVSHPVQGH